jgi:hypothetical protein
MNSQKLVQYTFVGALALVPFFLGDSRAEESKMKCETVKGYKCDARPDGTLYNCRNTTTEKCTVVSGPGSGKKAQVVSPGTATTTTAPKRVTPAAPVSGTLQKY